MKILTNMYKMQYYVFCYVNSDFHVNFIACKVEVEFPFQWNNEVDLIFLSQITLIFATIENDFVKIIKKNMFIVDP